VSVSARGLLGAAELWPQEQQLCATAAEGVLLDLRSRRPGKDDPTRGRQWSPERRIRAQLLFHLLTGSGPELTDGVVAVRVRGAQIVGRLNLGGWTLRCPLELYQCYLHCRLDLAKAEAPNISLRGSFLRSRLSARRLRVVHTLNLAGFRCDGGIALDEAHINGQLDCADAVFSNPDGEALSAVRLTVDTDMSLWKAQCTGKVRLSGAHISGQLNCTEAVFSNPGGQVLTAFGLIVDGFMFLKQVQCTGEVQLFCARIGNQLFCADAVFSNPDGEALNATGLTARNIVLARAQCTGEVQLAIAHIGGYLNCDEAIFCNPQGMAVDLELASVVQVVVMRPAVFHGGLNLHRAQVGAWHDERRTWPEQLRLEGFVYDSIKAPDAKAKDRVRLWLPRTDYLPQPYEQLAGAYRREGNEQAARIVAIGKQRAAEPMFEDGPTGRAGHGVCSCAASLAMATAPCSP
jgi:hypothetical protein